MRMKKPRRASIHEVRITREPDGAMIEFADPTISVVHLRLGPHVAEMSDAAILDAFNEMIDARDELAAQFENKVIEVLVGRPQIQYSEDAEQWVPRGNALRSHIEDDEQGELVVYVDDQKIDLLEFGRMLRTYAGWEMRIYFVDDDALAEEPAVEVRDPEDQVP